MRRVLGKGRSVLMLVLVLAAVPAARAQVTTDRAAALLEYPLIVANGDAADTVIQLSNASDQPVSVTCFYENTNGHCTNTGAVCHSAAACCGQGGCGVCLPGWNEINFHLRLTPMQPLGWRASEGLEEFPLDGVDRIGIGGSYNAASRVPALPEAPFVGSLKCLTVDAERRPTDDNVLRGAATITARAPTGKPDAARYNAIGLRAVEGANNGDDTLLLGGATAEYAGCPSNLILTHFFDLAVNPANGAPVQTVLVLVPCTEDLLRQTTGVSVGQYLVFNEFEQRFSTSRAIAGQQALPLSFIDTPDPTRSIFSASAAGTLTGQTLVRPVGSGLLGLAVEMHGLGCLGGLGCGFPPPATAAFELHHQGDRAIPDVIIIP